MKQMYITGLVALIALVGVIYYTVTDTKNESAVIDSAAQERVQ